MSLSNDSLGFSEKAADNVVSLQGHTQTSYAYCILSILFGGNTDIISGFHDENALVPLNLPEIRMER